MGTSTSIFAEISLSSPNSRAPPGYGRAVLDSSDQKKMLVRALHFEKSLRDLEVSDPAAGLEQWTPNQKYQLGEVLKSWSSFWQGAEKVLDFLIDVKPGVAGIHAGGWGRIIDRRRFGSLFIEIGLLLSQGAAFTGGMTRWVLEWIWSAGSSDSAEGLENLRPLQVSQEIADGYVEEQKTRVLKDWKSEEGVLERIPDEEMDALLERSADLSRAQRTIDNVFGFLLDNSVLIAGSCNGSDEESSSRARQYFRVGSKSSLWRLASGHWRKCSLSRSPIEHLFGRNEILVTEGDRSSIRKDAGFLVPLLLAQVSRLEPSPAPDVGPKPGDLLDAARSRLWIQMLAEISLLGAYQCLDDNIRDSDTARASHALGLLYQDCLASLLRALSECQEPEQETALGPQLILVLLYLAAKRYLVTAIDIYREERLHERRIQMQLGDCHVALGDLLLIWEQILDSAAADSSNSEHSLMKGISPDICKGVREEAMKVWLRQHIDDIEPQDVRQQAAEAYRDACMQFQREIEEYKGRYHLPSDVYLLHGDITDRQLHFEVCRAVSSRHWPYRRKHSPMSGQEAGRLLSSISRQLGVTLAEAYYSGGSRQEWLESIEKKAALAKALSSRESCMVLHEIDSEVGRRRFEPGWADGRSRGKEANVISGDVRDIHRFFRSYDDGLSHEDRPKASDPR